MIKFGPSGNSASFTAEGHSKTEQAAAWVKNRGLDCYEYSVGRGVNMGDEKAALIGEAFSAAGVEISVHAPYFINFASTEEEKAANSFRYLLDSARVIDIMGGRRIVFHPAAQGNATRESAVNLTLNRLKTLCDYVYANDMEHLYFCPETMGKLGQIGTIEEITEFCKTDKIFIPTVDFGHVNARERGSLKTEDDYGSRLDYMISELGFERMKNFHVHFSKIQYSEKGEVRHLTFEDDKYGPEFPPLAAALKKRGLEPIVVCESAGTQAEDAAEMKRVYFSLGQ
ncbi:MAG: TIM barrel protein [Clostridia bacterium]|nr:TIM barrel protein [Clostridia bacterium]